MSASKQDKNYSSHAGKSKVQSSYGLRKRKKHELRFVDNVVDDEIQVDHIPDDDNDALWRQTLTFYGQENEFRSAAGCLYVEEVDQEVKLQESLLPLDEVTLVHDKEELVLDGGNIRSKPLNAEDIKALKAKRSKPRTKRNPAVARSSHTLVYDKDECPGTVYEAVIINNMIEADRMGAAFCPARFTTLVVRRPRTLTKPKIRLSMYGGDWITITGPGGTERAKILSFQTFRRYASQKVCDTAVMTCTVLKNKRTQ